MLQHPHLALPPALLNTEAQLPYMKRGKLPECLGPRFTLYHEGQAAREGLLRDTLEQITSPQAQETQVVQSG